MSVKILGSPPRPEAVGDPARSKSYPIGGGVSCQPVYNDRRQASGLSPALKAHLPLAAASPDQGAMVIQFKVFHFQGT